MALTRSEIMSRIRSKNTKPEILLRRALRAAGLRGYRLHWGPFHIDVAWPGLKVAVFVDGAFWHGRLGKAPKTNQAFWRAKFKRNAARDAEANEALRRDGWVVVRYYDVDKRIPVGHIRRAVNARRAKCSGTQGPAATWAKSASRRMSATCRPSGRSTARGMRTRRSRARSTSATCSSMSRATSSHR